MGWNREVAARRNPAFRPTFRVSLPEVLDVEEAIGRRSWLFGGRRADSFSSSGSKPLTLDAAMDVTRLYGALWLIVTTLSRTVMVAERAAPVLGATVNAIGLSPFRGMLLVIVIHDAEAVAVHTH